VNGVAGELNAEQGLSSSKQSNLEGFSLELTMRVLSLYKKRVMQELRVAEEGEEPDTRSLASVIQDHHFESEEECSEHLLCYANVSEHVSDDDDGHAPVFKYEDLLMEAVAQEEALDVLREMPMELHCRRKMKPILKWLRRSFLECSMIRGFLMKRRRWRFQIRMVTLSVMPCRQVLMMEVMRERMRLKWLMRMRRIRMLSMRMRECKSL
jgi:hypothetical protein